MISFQQQIDRSGRMVSQNAYDYWIFMTIGEMTKKGNFYDLQLLEAKQDKLRFAKPERLGRGFALVVGQGRNH